MTTKTSRSQARTVEKNRDGLPLWTFCGVLLVTVFVYLFPPDINRLYRPDSPPSRVPAQPRLFGYPVDLSGASAQEDDPCYVCTRMVWCGPGGDGNPDTGRFCCTRWKYVCNQSPTIIGALNCSSTGNGGWCAGTLLLELSASDPQGQTVQISGDVDGTPFACTNGATGCSVPLPERSGAANFQVTSVGGADSDSLAYQRDGTAPQINGSLSGTSGDNGWYVSTVEATASAGDSVSGVDAFEYELNGSGWAAYSPLTLSDGEHVIEYRAVDQAGNQNEFSQSLKVDTLTPTLNVSLSGASGSNGWYRSNVQAEASADDSGSGLDELEYELDGSGWTSYTAALTLTDGEHSLSVRAVDAAGNVTQSDQSINVDTITPLINLLVTGTAGSGGWYVSEIAVSASGSDGGSGLASFEYSFDDGTWTAYTTALDFEDGQYSMKFRAVDMAGNTTTPAISYRVDATPPVIDLPEAWDLGFTAPYEASDQESGVASVRIVIEDDLERWPKLAWNDAAQSEIPWDGRFADGNKAPDGEYLATIKAQDRAGNESVKTAIITIESNLLTDLFLPPFTPPSEPPLPVGEGGGEGEIPVTSFGGEANDDASIPVTGLFTAGGLTTVAGTANTVTFASEAPLGPEKLPGTDILWGPLAAAAIGAFSAEILRRRQEEEEELAARQESGPSGYQQKIKARKKAEVAAEGMALARAEQARKDAIAEARVLGKEAMIEAETRAYSAKPQEWEAAAVLGGSKGDKSKEESTMKVSAMPMPGEDQPEAPGFFEWLIEGALDFLDSIVHFQNYPRENPLDDVNTLYGQAVQTVIAQVTQTAQSLQAFTPTPATSPTATSTPLPGIPKIVLVEDGLNLRRDPSMYATVVLPKGASIPNGKLVYVDPSYQPVVADGFCWARVIYHDPDINAGALAASPQFIDPLDDFVRWTAHGVTIEYFNAMNPPWLGTHVGEDYTPLAGGDPNPVIRASAPGIVSSSGVQNGYGNHVVIEYPPGSMPEGISKLPGYKAGNSLYAIYGHLLNDVSNTLQVDKAVSAGMPIGTMGASGNTGGFTHLHLELRVGPPNQSLDGNTSNWYDENWVYPIDPATVFTPTDTFEGWAAQYQCTPDGQPIGEPNLGPAP